MQIKSEAWRMFLQKLIYSICQPVSTAADGFVSVSKSPLMQIVMLVLVESIRRTLCTGSLKLKSILVSEAARVWIITSLAFTDHACGERTCSLLFYHLLSLSLFLFFPLVSQRDNTHSLQFFLSPLFSLSLICLCFCLPKLIPFLHFFLSFSPFLSLSLCLLFYVSLSTCS